MSTAAIDDDGWPREVLWDYSVALYGLADVEAACLELQQRHGIDVNLVLLCLWLGERGVALDAEMLARMCHAAGRWQVEVVKPLRALRACLKGRIADREPNSVAGDRPRIAASLRARTMALEIDAEHLEQLHLGRAAASLRATATPGPALAGANLRNYWRFDRRDHEALRVLLTRAFARASAAELDAGLRWLDGARD